MLKKKIEAIKNLFPSSQGYIGLILLLMVVLGVILAGGVGKIGNTETPVFGNRIDTNPSPGSKESLQLKTLDIVTVTPSQTTGFTDCAGNGTQSTEIGLLGSFSYDASTKRIILWENDESAMVLGQNPKSNPPPNVSAFNGNPSGHVTNPSIGDPNAKDPQNSKFPEWPAIFISDPGTTDGDVQNGGTGIEPNDIYGTWKEISQSDPTPNMGNYSPSTDTPPACSGDCDYRSELTWNTANLHITTPITGGMLAPGSTYRAQFLVHDGDGGGGDVAVGCINFTY